MILYPFTITSDLLTLTVGGEETGHTLKSLYDADWNTYFQNDTANEIVTIDIDLGENKAVDYLIIGNHNILDAGIKLAYDTNNNGSYSGLTYLIGSAGGYKGSVIANESIWVETFNQVTKRYFRFIIEDVVDLKSYLGIVSLGEARSILPYNFGNERGNVYQNSEQVSPGGVIRSISNFGGKKVFNIQFDNLNQNNLNYWLETIDNANGDIFPFFIKDIDDSYYYVRFQNKNLNFRKIEHELYAMQTNLIQENV